ncbi:MAG: hypothetical protein H7X95_08930, partial [Deltaproteobacteria bacterium]|nr:hypothetical protein [Deltaproteobacteria bacterium]
SPFADASEARALRQTLAATASATPVIAVKASLGEAMDAGGLVQTLVALSALRSGQAPPIPLLEDPAVSGLRYLRTASDVAGEHALVTSTSSTGACSALVVSTSERAG